MSDVIAAHQKGRRGNVSRPVLRDHPAGPGPGQGCCRRDGHITRIEEYLDSGQRAMIKAARDALTS